MFIFGLCLHTSLSPRGGVCFSCTHCYLEGCGLSPRRTPHAHPSASSSAGSGDGAPAPLHLLHLLSERGKGKHSSSNKEGKGERCEKDGKGTKDGRVLMEEHQSHLGMFRVSSKEPWFLYKCIISHYLPKALLFTKRTINTATPNAHFMC